MDITAIKGKKKFKGFDQNLVKYVGEQNAVLKIKIVLVSFVKLSCCLARLENVWP